MPHLKSIQRLLAVTVCVLGAVFAQARISSAQIGSWGIDRIDQRVLPLDGVFGRQAAAASVPMYVVDTGVRADHEEISASPALAGGHRHGSCDAPAASQGGRRGRVGCFISRK